MIRPLPVTAEEGLKRLIDGNERFLNGTARFPTVQKDVLAALAHEQHPYATIVGCSDSRVPPELIFDANFGELFVIRVAGNVLSPEVAGSMQYAGMHLKTPLFVVLGHENCGAVQAALDKKFRNASEPSRIEILLQNILPGLDDIDAHAGPAGTGGAGGGSERPLDDAADSRIARRSRPRGGRSIHGGGGNLRNRYRQGAVPGACLVIDFSTGAGISTRRRYLV